MTDLLRDIHRQRVQFGYKNYPAPNRLLVPWRLHHQLLGEAIDVYGPSCFTAGVKNLHIEDMRVILTEHVSQIEVALSLK